MTTTTIVARIGISLLLVACVSGLRPQLEGTDSSGSDCDQYTSCATCAGINNCGWCSTPIVYQNGSHGPQCASPSSSTPFTCDGIYSTSQCIQGYICNQATGQCDLAAPGNGVQQPICQAACTVGPSQKVYGCLPGTKVCVEVPAGTPGSASRAQCEQHCVTPPAQVYLCNASGGVCVVVPAGTPGAASKEVCEAKGCDYGIYGCDLSDYTCKQGFGNVSEPYCQSNCRAPDDPCEPNANCAQCLTFSHICGWCSANVTYASGQQGSQCAGVNSSILPFQCLGTYSTKLCNGSVVPTATTTGVPPTFSPTLPPDNKPYLRFGHTIPTRHQVTANVTQGTISYEWTDYAFAQFSRWVEIFEVGDAVITIYDAANGKPLLAKTIKLTPGPLVIVTKDFWPPFEPYNIETIAASYAPPRSGSGVRLFNLSPDTPSASMTSSGDLLAVDIPYSLGSGWSPVPNSTATYVASNYNTGEQLATDTFTAPPAPFVFTNFLIGLANTTDSAVKVRLVPLVDAPE